MTSLLALAVIVGGPLLVLWITATVRDRRWRKPKDRIDQGWLAKCYTRERIEGFRE